MDPQTCCQTAAPLFFSDLRVKFFTTGVLPQTAPPYHIAGLLFISIAFYTKELLVLYDVKSVVHYLQRAKHYKVGFRALDSPVA